MLARPFSLRAFAPAPWSVALLATSLMAACGGGSGGDDTGAGGTPTAAVEGAWSGSSDGSGSTGGALAIIVEDGRYWMLENLQQLPINGGILVPRGVTIGRGSAADGRFSSGGARQFLPGTAGSTAVSLAASYAPAATLTGAIDDAQGERYQFTLDQYDASYAQALPPGTFDGLRSEGSATIGEAGSVTDLVFADDETFSGALISGCPFHGQLTPRTHGRAFELAVDTEAFTADPEQPLQRDCAAAHFTGIAYPVTGGLYLIATTAAHDVLFTYIGSGPFY